MSDVGHNAINHFACQDGVKALVLDGSVQPGNVGWKMRARCARRHRSPCKTLDFDPANGHPCEIWKIP